MDRIFRETGIAVSENKCGLGSIEWFHLMGNVNDPYFRTGGEEFSLE